MARYRARDVGQLRDLMKTPRRLVPHSVRSLAVVAETHHSIIGYLLSGERTIVDEKVAQRIAETFGFSLCDLFLPESSSAQDEAEKREAS